MKIDLHRIIKLAGIPYDPGIPGVVGGHGIAESLSTVVSRTLGMKMVPQDRSDYGIDRSMSITPRDDESFIIVEVSDHAFTSQNISRFRFPKSLVEEVGGWDRYKHDPIEKQVAQHFGEEKSEGPVDWDNYRQPIRDESVQLYDLEPQEALAFLRPGMFIELRVGGLLSTERLEGSGGKENEVRSVHYTQEEVQAQVKSLFRELEKKLKEYARDQDIVVWIHAEDAKFEEEDESIRGAVMARKYPRWKIDWGAGVLIFDLQRTTGFVSREPIDYARYQDTEFGLK